MNRVGQTTGAGDMSDADQTLYNQMMQAGASSSAAAGSDFAQAVTAPATTTPSTSPAATAVAGPSLSPTTLVVGGVIALGLIWFLTRK